ncbi:probable carbohydrate esterase At4g34215 [Salvia miltiorrhiza]|uniref:probable carbohydrate esterase At4g34215 n=1 Tax=Salvia miltiorrhiza TaxID=226208 RepID=UPI0025ABABA8|nr:probable carbohydrate esterase At4g34215 [Salvia miltiorrhiza]XP_057768567.1 probable carbohydrate esterase At4g34215 [Salvia miltiorrhiza]
MALMIFFLVAFFLRASSSSACDKAIFLLAGQSNMAGRGGIFHNKWDGYTPPLCRASPRILRLNNQTAWEEAREPLHGNISFAPCPGSNAPAGIGPGMAFANTLLKRDPTIGTIGLVPCAVGMTGISDWRRGSCLYARLMSRARAALREGGALRGMLWYQGENDINVSTAGMYEDRLRTFFNDVRNDLSSPSLPIIQVALASPNISTNSGTRKIRSIQLHLKLPNLMCVDAKGLAVDDYQKLHLTTDAQVKLGSKMAHAFVKHFT